MLDAGGMIAGGTDAPVEAGDPRVEFYAAIARRTLEGFAGPDWGLDQRLTRDEALAILTSGAAYAAFEEKDRGTIEPGKLADFSVFSARLDADPGGGDSAHAGRDDGDRGRDRVGSERGDSPLAPERAQVTVPKRRIADARSRR